MRKTIKKILDNHANKEYFNNLLINESFDKPFRFIKKIGDFTYVGGENNTPIVKYTFRLFLNKINNDNIIGEPKKIYEISWDWVNGVDDKEKNRENWVKSTTTTLKVISDFNSTINPNIIVINETEKTKKIYRGLNFIEKLRILFTDFMISTDYNEETDINRILLIKKNISRFGEDMINKTHEQCGGDRLIIKERIQNPKKKHLKGIDKKFFKDRQLKRIILSEIFLTNLITK